MEKDTNEHYNKRYKLWFAAFVQVGFLAGVAYGWANLEEILERIGYWSNDPSTQATNYGLVYTVGSWFTQAGRLFVGIYLDKFGVRVTTMTGCTLSCLGLLLFAISNTGMNLVWPAFILVCLGGPAVQLSTQSVSSLFENKATVMSSLSWGLQLSSLWFLVCNVLNENGVNASLLFICYSAIAGFLCLWCFLIYPFRFEAGGGRGGRSKSRKSMLITSGRYKSNFLETGSLKEMACSIDYILLNVWYAFYILYLQFYVMTVKAQTELRTGKSMAVAFNLCLCTVSASAMIVGIALDKFGFGVVVSFNIASAIGSTFCITSGEELVQWIGFILYVIARITTYATFFSFIGINFGFKNFGALAGMGLFTSGCFSIFQYLCLYLVENYPSVDYNGVNIFFMILLALSGGLYAFWLFFNEREPAQKESPGLINPTGSPKNSKGLARSVSF